MESKRTHIKSGSRCWIERPVNEKRLIHVFMNLVLSVASYFKIGKKSSSRGGIKRVNVRNSLNEKITIGFVLY